MWYNFRLYPSVYGVLIKEIVGIALLVINDNLLHIEYVIKGGLVKFVVA